MNLTDGEKLIIVMLADIHKQTVKSGNVDPAYIEDAISDGHLWAIKQKYPGIYNPEETPTKVVNDVYDFLTMWEAIEHSYDNLSIPEKTLVDAQTASSSYNRKFAGFDGNNETEYMSVARWLERKLGLYTFLAGRNLNSHSPSVAKYRNMNALFKPMISSSAMGQLDANQLITLINTR